MKSLLKNHQAISAVVATLIIMIITVLLATVVTYLAINVVNTRVEQEDLSITMQHIWYNSPAQTSEVGFYVVNTGGKDIAIQKIEIRGQTVTWNQVFYVRGPFQDFTGLSYLSTVADSAPTDISDGQGGFKDLISTTTALTLKSGDSMVVYVYNPSVIVVNDVGTTVSLNVFTSDACFYKEANVQGS
jgi:hypothetical protein